MWRRQPASPTPAPPRPAGRGLLALIDDPAPDLAVPRCLVTALGPDLENRETVLAALVPRLKAEGRRPVICATDLALPFLVDCPAAVELLPRRRDLAVLDPAEYDGYLCARWELVLAKWQITEEITLGQDFDSFRQGQAMTS